MSLSVLLACFLAILGFYALGMSRMRLLPSPIYQVVRLACFCFGLVVALVTFIQSADIFGPGYRFTASMGQMLLAIELAPPLILLSIPPAALRSVYPSKHSQSNLPIILILGSLAAVISLGWFTPYFFEAASANFPIWLIRQVTLLFCGFILWWPAIALIPIWKPNASQDLICLFLFRLPLAFVGLLMTFSRRLSYSPRAIVVEICAPASLVDQQIGGQMMWIVSGLIIFIGLLVIFIQWIKVSSPPSVSA